MNNYKIRVIDEEFFMMLTQDEYNGISMLSELSHGAIEIILTD